MIVTDGSVEDRVVVVDGADVAGRAAVVPGPPGAAGGRVVDVGAVRTVTVTVLPGGPAGPGGPCGPCVTGWPPRPRTCCSRAETFVWRPRTWSAFRMDEYQMNVTATTTAEMATASPLIAAIGHGRSVNGGAAGRGGG